MGFAQPAELCECKSPSQSAVGCDYLVSFVDKLRVVESSVFFDRLRVVVGSRAQGFGVPCRPLPFAAGRIGSGTRESARPERVNCSVYRRVHDLARCVAAAGCGTRAAVKLRCCGPELGG